MAGFFNKLKPGAVCTVSLPLARRPCAASRAPPPCDRASARESFVSRGVAAADRDPPSQASANATNQASPGKKKEKEEPAPELTPLEKMLQNAGPIREDGTDKFLGLENVSASPPIDYPRKQTQH